MPYIAKFKENLFVEQDGTSFFPIYMYAGNGEEGNRVKIPVTEEFEVKDTFYMNNTKYAVIHKAMTAPFVVPYNTLNVELVIEDKEGDS
jgi:hypothetical protein